MQTTQRPDDYFVATYVAELDEKIWNPKGSGLVFPVFYGRNNFNQKNQIHIQNNMKNKDYHCCSLLHIQKGNKVYPEHYGDGVWNFAYELDRSEANFTKVGWADLMSCYDDHKTILLQSEKINGLSYRMILTIDNKIIIQANSGLDLVYNIIDNEVLRIFNKLKNALNEGRVNINDKQSVFKFIKDNDGCNIFRWLDYTNYQTFITIYNNKINVKGLYYEVSKDKIEKFCRYNEIVAQPHNLPGGQPNDNDILQIKRLIIDVDNQNVSATKKLVDDNYDKIVKFVQDKTTKHDIRIIDKNTKKTQIMSLDQFLTTYSTKYNQQKNSKALQQTLNENLLLPVQTIDPRANIIKRNYISNNQYIKNYSNQQLQRQSCQYQPKIQNIQNIKPTIQQFAPKPNIQQKSITSTTNTQPIKTTTYPPQPVYPIYPAIQQFASQPNYIQQKKPFTFTPFTQSAKTTTFSPQPVYPIYTKPQTCIPVIQTSKYLKPVFKPTPLSQTYHTIPTPTTNNNQIAIKGYTQHHSNRAKKVLDLILSNKLKFSNNLSETDINNFILALCTDNRTNQIFSSLNNGAPYIYNGQPKYHQNIISNTINNPYVTK